MAKYPRMCEKVVRDADDPQFRTYCVLGQGHEEDGEDCLDSFGNTKDQSGHFTSRFDHQRQ